MSGRRAAPVREAPARSRRTVAPPQSNGRPPAAEYGTRAAQLLAFVVVLSVVVVPLALLCTGVLAYLVMR